MKIFDTSIAGWIIFALLVSFCICYGKSWKPEKTHALIVGVLEWTDGALVPYPKENRQDRALEAQLIADGVPEQNIVFIEDRAATLDSMINALNNIAKESYHTLIFYYAGHGIREGNATFFANYAVDTKKTAETGFSLYTLRNILQKKWQGKRLFLLADCCHSGALASVVGLYEGSDIRAACITSVVASNVSTERWTFTKSLVSVFAGDWIVDRDRDCSIIFAEADTFIQQEMRYLENQLTYAVVTSNFSDGFVFRKATVCAIDKYTKGPWKLMQYVECEWEGKWWLAQIIDIREDEWKVHYINYDESWDEWVDKSRLREPVGIAVKPRDRMEVEWGGKWWKAEVIEIMGDFAFIHYDGYGSEWDEWVTKERIKK
jgi:hypothetical protein